MPGPAFPPPVPIKRRRSALGLLALSALAALALTPAASARSAELWTIAPVARRGGRAIVAERAGAVGAAKFTLDVSDGAVLAVPAIALDGMGGAAAAWVRKRPAGNEIVAARFDGRAWSSPVRVARSSRYLGQPALAAAGKGGYWIAAVRDAGRGDDIVVFRWNGGTAREISVFGESGAPDIEPRLERGLGGELRLAWQAFRDGDYATQEKTLEAGSGEASPAAGERVLAAAPAPPPVQASPSRGGIAWSEGTRLLSAPLTDEPQPTAVVTAAPTAAVSSVAAATDLSLILGLGDSTTWGRGSSYQGPPTDYLTRLENRLRGPWTAINGGRPGYTSARLLGAADAFLVRRPGLTLLMVGINDAFMHYSYDSVVTNVRALVTKARAAGSRVILATTTPVIDSGDHLDQYQQLNDVVNPAIRAVAAATKVPLVDVWSYFASLPDWRDYVYLPHGNHLNDAGYELVASRFLAELQKNDLQLPATGSARGLLLADVSLGVWDLPARGDTTQAENAGAGPLLLDTVSPLADNGIVAAAPLDPDGDGVDAIAVVRARAGGVSLTLYAAPPAGTADPDALRAAVAIEAQADWLSGVCACPEGEERRSRSITHLFAVDQDGDGRDEFGIVCNRTCAPPAGAAVERQVVEIWRAHQPGGAPAERVVMDEWRLPAAGRIHDVSAVQVDADAPQEILLLTQEQRLEALHTLPAANPDAIRLLESGRYGRLFDCATDVAPAIWKICSRWKSRDMTTCGLLELRTLTPRVMIYDTPPTGAATLDANSEPLLYSWWFTDFPEIAARCTDTGEEWFERPSDVLSIAAADIDSPVDGRDEVLVLRLGVADTLEAWSLPPLPASSQTLPARVALDRWVRTGGPHQYLLREGTLPGAGGGARRGLYLWRNRRN